MLNSELRLVLITAFHCSGVMRCNMASLVMPALLTSTSIGPERGFDLLDARTAGLE